MDLSDVSITLMLLKHLFGQFLAFSGNFFSQLLDFLWPFLAGVLRRAQARDLAGFLKCASGRE